jgi:hypothetical protein
VQESDAIYVKLSSMEMFLNIGAIRQNPSTEGVERAVLDWSHACCVKKKKKLTLISQEQLGKLQQKR